ncbi:hypothetical protein [Synechococcus sp. CBW1006]|uniref:hypothetical protein n=1 Tax=Synechococcus sp. CBW1006 TaxID=1353138 RepID=UPI0018CE6C22|nr:hypothetical protein [Synechococcus sp. CBW1006]QPN65824.1 hypothetical protein H8F26_13100 [Synechococcus sp. CBW1006]
MWLPLAQLRALPLSPGALLALLNDLQRTPQRSGPIATAEELLLEIANLTTQQLRRALDERELEQALEALEALRQHVKALVAAQPEKAEPFWSRYGELLAQVAVRVHGAVFGTDGEAALEGERRAGICWDVSQALEAAASLPLVPPEWLPVYEQQLVQEGALAWRDRSEAEAGERSLDLFLRLAELLDPAPEWVTLACRDLLQARLEPLLQEAELDGEALGPVLERLARLRVLPERQEAFAAAVLRAKLALELIQIQRGTGRQDGLELVEAEWLDADVDPPGRPEASLPLELVLWGSQADSEQHSFDLAPFVDGDLEGAAAALEAFLEDQRRASQPAQRAALSLQRCLQQGDATLRLTGVAVLSQAAQQWQKALETRCQPLPAVAWRQGMVVELEPIELVLLLQLQQRRPALEEALVAMRRRHHDTAFWQEANPEGPMALWSAEAVLREWHRAGGFYASSHAPIESLLRWAQPALAALQQAQGWSAEASSQALALPLLEAGGIVATPGEGSLAESLGGLEVVYVGARWEAVQRAHRDGQPFVGEAFGLRCLPGPSSCHPMRPAAGFEDSLADCGSAVEQLHQQRPFDVLLAECGAYRLPLALAMQQRFGVRTVCGGGSVADWLQGRCMESAGGLDALGSPQA